MNLGGTVRLNKTGVICVSVLILLLFYYMNRSGSYRRPASVNLRHLLYVSIEIAERGGIEVSKASKERDLARSSKGKTKEGADVPVTAADLRSHCAMVQPLRDLFPSLTVISEEMDPGKCEQSLPVVIDSKGLPELDDVEVSTDDLVVWIDPLDATQEFTEGMMEYVTTMVCVAHKGVPIIGVVHRPFSNTYRTYWAWKNQGHSKIPSSSALQQSQDGDSSSDKVMISRSHPGTVENIITKALGSKVTIQPAGGSGYKVIQLLVGNATVYTHVTDIHKWDICAGDALLTALGGRFSTLEDDEIPYGAASSQTNSHGVLASAPGPPTDKHSDLARSLYQVLPKH